MKAVLEIELIGDDSYEALRMTNRRRYPELPPCVELRARRLGRPELRPWVARVIPIPGSEGYRREMIAYQHKDYSRANSVGSRGVYAYYLLSPGVYEIHQRTSWKHGEQYYLQVKEDGTKQRLGDDEVREWLRNAS